MDKSASESDLNTLDKTTPPSFIITRSKRVRQDSVTVELNEFKEEMRQLVASLVSNQMQELQKITPTLRGIQQSNQNIEQAVALLTAQNEEFRKKIEVLENRTKEDRKQITMLEDKLEDMQRNSRKANFEIRNVPKKNNETREDLIDMVKCLSENLGGGVKRQDIRDIYRVRGKKVITNAPIIVETNSTMVKTEVLKLSKAFNIKHKAKLCAKHLGLRIGEDTPVFVAEQLTAKAARLHFLARDLAKTKSYKFCWTAFGKVYVRKDEASAIISIHSEAQVNQLIQQGA